MYIIRQVIRQLEKLSNYKTVVPWFIGRGGWLGPICGWLNDTRVVGRPLGGAARPRLGLRAERMALGCWIATRALGGPFVASMSSRYGYGVARPEGQRMVGAW